MNLTMPPNCFSNWEMTSTCCENNSRPIFAFWRMRMPKKYSAMPNSMPGKYNRTPNSMPANSRGCSGLTTTGGCRPNLRVCGNDRQSAPFGGGRKRGPRRRRLAARALSQNENPRHRPLARTPHRHRGDAGPSRRCSSRRMARACQLLETRLLRGVLWTIRITRPLTSHLAMTAPIWQPAARRRRLTAAALT